MPSYPVPDNEVQRLQAVAALAFAADTPDPALDALVRVAAQAFEVPAAVISLMQADHQVFVARVGVDVSELARHESLCNPLLMAPQTPWVVEDLSADPRYAAHPLVQGEAALRLYAGAALCDEQGLALGTLVLLETEAWPTWTAAQRQTLQDLALIASRTLQTGRRLRGLAQLAEVDTLTGLRPAAHFLRSWRWNWPMPCALASPSPCWSWSWTGWMSSAKASAWMPPTPPCARRPSVWPIRYAWAMCWRAWGPSASGC